MLGAEENPEGVYFWGLSVGLWYLYKRSSLLASKMTVRNLLKWNHEIPAAVTNKPPSIVLKVLAMSGVYMSQPACISQGYYTDAAAWDAAAWA